MTTPRVVMNVIGAWENPHILQQDLLELENSQILKQDLLGLCDDLAMTGHERPLVPERPLMS